MGVPGFFSWLTKQYKENKLIIDQLPKKPNTLYIDANCLFHPQCFIILDGMSNENDRNILENKMMQRILNYIDYLIGYVDPQELVYIAVDGVAPLAKINQQRKRRYRSIQDNDIKNDIKKKHNLKVNNNWNNTVITPGTEFMEKLHIELSNHLKKKKIKIIYSSYHSFGEGEHKILQHIKNRKTSKKQSFVIYGLDADLFFLSMASQINNIYLLREDSQLNGVNRSVKELYDLVEDIAEDLKYVSIDVTKECYNDQIKNILKTKMDQRNMPEIDFSNNDFCNDFIFLCYLLGNDFLPHFPSIDIKKYGLDIILDCYTDIYIDYEENIIKVQNNNVDINNYIFIQLIKKISDYEYNFFTKILPGINRRKDNKTCLLTDPYSKEVWELENMKNMIIDDPVKLGIGIEQEWKFRYYEHYFHTNEYQDETINEVCKCYLEGLKWVTLYYFQKCPDWRWQYVYNHAPFLSDMYRYINKNVDLNKIEFNNNEPINCCTQLLCVLPPSCNNILPKEYRNLINTIQSPIIDMFPEKIELDMLNKDAYWQCIPLLPTLDIDRILDATKSIKLSGEDKNRNKVLKEITFN